MPINCDSNKLFSKIDSRQLIIISWPNINESSRSSREWRNSRLVRSNRKQVGGSARTLLYIQLGGTGQRFVLEQPLFRSFSRFLVVSYTHKLYCACSLKECYPGLWSEARLICCNMCSALFHSAGHKLFRLCTSAASDSWPRRWMRTLFCTNLAIRKLSKSIILSGEYSSIPAPHRLFASSPGKLLIINCTLRGCGGWWQGSRILYCVWWEEGGERGQRCAMQLIWLSTSETTQSGKWIIIHEKLRGTLWDKKMHLKCCWNELEGQAYYRAGIACIF